jgi:tRNA isopentenyl-2-thiomethyl-A-37 hydroxylase MiaE
MLCDGRYKGQLVEGELDTVVELSYKQEPCTVTMYICWSAKLSREESLRHEYLVNSIMEKKEFNPNYVNVIIDAVYAASLQNSSNISVSNHEPIKLMGHLSLSQCTF